VPPPEDIDRIRLVANMDERDFIECVYHTLARRSEVVRPTWEDVNFEQRWVRLYTRKRRGGELQGDYLPMNDTLFKVLHDRWKVRDKDSLKVFSFTPHELRYMMERLVRKANKAIKGKGKERKIKPFGFHAIRHHVSSILNDSGKANMKQIQKLLRHRRQSTTEIYLHSVNRDLHEAASLLNGQSGTHSTPERVVEGVR
jgi:integrase